MNLTKYLAQLNSSETQWGIWVDPESPLNNYRIGQKCFENGGVLDNFVFIGTLDRLSFGYQSIPDALKNYLESLPVDAAQNQVLSLNGRKVALNIDGILAAFEAGTLATEFEAFITSKALEIIAVCLKRTPLFL